MQLERKRQSNNALLDALLCEVRALRQDIKCIRDDGSRITAASDEIRVHRIGEVEPRGILAKPASHRADEIGFDAWMRERTEATHQAMMLASQSKKYATGGMIPRGFRLVGECGPELADLRFERVAL